MQLLRDESLRSGEPRLETVPGQALPQLSFGSNAVSDSFEIVDRMREVMGGSASLFAKDGERFVRVSTNVRKKDGSRAVGTKLNPDGPVIVNIRKGLPFNELVDILGKPYLADYEPIRSGNGEFIGIYYVGYALDSLAVVGDTIAKSGLMKHGFFALADSRNQIVSLTFDKERGSAMSKMAKSMLLGQKTVASGRSSSALSPSGTIKSKAPFTCPMCAL